MKILDLTFKGNFDSNLSEELNIIANDNIEKFNSFIGEISKSNINNIDWWSEGPASRNTYSSPLFFRFISLIFIDKIINESKFHYNTILTDSSEFKNILELHLLNKGLSINVININKHFTKNLKKITKYIYLYFYFIIRMIYIKTIHLKSNLDLNKIIIIDTFILPNYVKKKNRWYGDFINEANTKFQNIYLIPTIVNASIFECFSTVKYLKNKDLNKYIFKDLFVTFKDLNWIFLSFLRKRRIKLIEYNLFNIDLSKLVFEEYNNNSDLFTVFESLFTYKFFENFSKKNIKITHAIDWFEGQSIDKIWTYSIRKYFSNCNIIGYRGGGDFNLHLSNYPTNFENNANILPDIFLINGKSQQINLNKYCIIKNFVIIPAFRTEYLWNNFSTNKYNNFNILITFPISLNISKEILNNIIKANESISKNNLNFKFILKLHPAFKKNREFYNILNVLPNNFVISSNNFIEDLKTTSLLITEASGTCLESMAFGVPVLVVKNTKGLFYDPIPNGISEFMYKYVTNSIDIEKYIMIYYNYFLNNSFDFTNIASVIKNEYFEPNNKSLNFNNIFSN